MPRIMNISGFRICQSSQYNEPEVKIVLEQAEWILEIELFYNLLFPFKTKINQASF